MILSTDQTATYQLLANELKSRGYSVSTELQNRRVMVSYTSPAGKTWRTAAARIRYPFTSDAASRLSRDKAAAYAFAEKKNIPVPFTRRVGFEPFLDDELAQIVQTYAPLIVKPNDSSLSRGLTLHIETVDNLKNAVRLARLVNDSDVLIQQQVSGEEIRFMVIKGKVVAALLRQTPRVVGDGKKTIEALINEENLHRKMLTFPYISYPQLTKELIDEKYFHDQRVPKLGEIIEFSKATMIKNGCSVYQILDQVHPSYIQEIETLVEGIDASFLAVDFLIKDFRAQSDSTNHWFLEFNSSPVLKMCYGCRDGVMFDIIPYMADLIDESLS